VTKYRESIRAAGDAPREMEALYRTAKHAGDIDAFADALLACRAEQPKNMLYAAWHYRLYGPNSEARAQPRHANWALAIPMGILVGLIFWILSDPAFTFPDSVPFLALAWSPISACFVIVFLAITSGQWRRRATLCTGGLVGAGLYIVLLVTLQQRGGYRDLMMLHLPMLGLICAGVSLLGSASAYRSRFAFLIRSFEAIITGGLFVMAGGAFTGITVGLFEVLGITIPDGILRLIVAGGAGAIPILAVASVYEPRIKLAKQRFDQGLSNLIATMMRLLLPLVLLVLAVNIVFIPLNFMEPFHNRDMLIVYNVMLFAVMGLLVGATPVHPSDLSPKQSRLLRRGILALAILTVLISIYALSATLYRTFVGYEALRAGLTINRLTIIGWNTINIAILIALIYRLLRSCRGAWIASVHRVIGQSAIAYGVWTILLIVAIPLLFGY